MHAKVKHCWTALRDVSWAAIVTLSQGRHAHALQLHSVGINTCTVSIQPWLHVSTSHGTQNQCIKHGEKQSCWVVKSLDQHLQNSTCLPHTHQLYSAMAVKESSKKRWTTVSPNLHWCIGPGWLYLFAGKCIYTPYKRGWIVLYVKYTTYKLLFEFLNTAIKYCKVIHTC